MRVAIVGITGLVGKKLLELLQTSSLPIKELRLFASRKSSGKIYQFKDEYICVEALEDEKFLNIDLAFFCIANELAIKYIPLFLENQTVIIDNSSAYRLDQNVPLIIPEINFKKAKLMANPNCSTIQLALPLKHLDDLYEVKRVDVSTYQAISGAGLHALDDFINGKENILYPIINNAIPQIDEFTPNGYTKEEMKIILETRKILNKDIEVNATSVRIPVTNAHSESVTISFHKKPDIEEIKNYLSMQENIIVIDDIDNKLYPMAKFANNRIEVFIGRIRRDIFDEYKISLWIVSDNLLKGASYNALQIALKYFSDIL